MANPRANASSGSSGCAWLFGMLLLIGAVVAVAISVAAIVDPFNWLPPIGEIWNDDGGELSQRFPGFWWHVVVNLAYATVAAGALVVFLATVGDLRTTRAARFDSTEAMGAFHRAARQLRAAGGGLAALAFFPILVAIV